MSRSFHFPPRDEFEADWLLRLEWAADAGELTMADGKDLLRAVHYLRYEVEAAKEALARMEDGPGGPPRDEPVGPDVVEWVEARIQRARELIGQRLYQSDRREGQRAAAELRRTNWLVLGALAPEVFGLRMREAALRLDPIRIVNGQVELVATKEPK